MPTIRTLEDLAALLDQVIKTEPSLEALQQRGLTVSVNLQRQMEVARPVKILSSVERAQWAQKVREIGPVDFAVGTIPLAPPGLTRGEYDFIFGLRLEAVNEVLTARYAGLTWPHELKPNQAAQFFPLDELKVFTDGIPDGEKIQVGSLRFTAAPTVSQMAGTDKLILHQAISLDINDQIIVPHRRVTSLDCVLIFGVQVEAVIEDGQLPVIFDGDAAVTGTPKAVHIIVATDSPPQPRSAQALTDLEAAMNLKRSFAGVLGKIHESYSISPEVCLPIGSGDPVQVQQVYVRSVETGNGGALVVGVLLGLTKTPDKGAGNPNRLINPFSSPSTNVYARVH